MTITEPQPTWTEAAVALLTTAEGAQVADPADPDGTVALGTLVARRFIAPGPEMATDCSLLAVYFAGISALPGLSFDALGGECLIVPSVLLVLRFRQDCVPTQNDNGAPPTPAAVEAWSLRYLDQATALWQAVADAVLGGALDVGGCGAASMEDATPYGPLGGIAGLDIPVRVRLQA